MGSPQSNSKMPFLNKIGKCENLQCGLIQMVDDLPVPIPLKNVHIDAKVVDFVSQVTITQEYVNHESGPIEILYSYPVEESAAIIAFGAVVDGHEIEAEVKKKDEAKAEYKQAMIDGNTAILLEETKADIFSMKLGQLKAGAGAKVKLTYIMELPVEEKCIKLTIPTTIAPRYIPQSDDSESAKEIANLTYNTEGEKGQIPLHINIDSIMKGKIRKITSPSHTLESEIKELADENGQYLAKTGLGDTTTDVMDRDLVIFIQSEENSKPVVFVEKSKDSLAALVSLIPSFKLDNQNVELIFLVDRSGSMGGESMNQAKGALELFLHSIPADCYFNIWSFGSRFSSLFENGSKKYDDFTLAEAKTHTNQMTANFGGTEVYRPLEAIFNEKSIPGYAKQIFLLTDGDVSNDHSVIKLVKDHCKKARVFSLGLGSSASRHLVKGVARAGNGTSIFASLNEDLRPKVMTLLKNALMPSLTNVEILWNNKKEEQPELAPNKERTLLGFNKPDPKVTKEMTTCPGVLFDGSRMLAFNIFENDETLENVTITAQAPDGPLSVSISIGDECFLTSGKLVHQMAARRQIQELEDGNSEYIPEDVKEQISDLALKYCIASKHTSFIGVDKKTRKSVLGQVMSSHQIQQEVPRALRYDRSQCITQSNFIVQSQRICFSNIDSDFECSRNIDSDIDDSIKLRATKSKSIGFGNMFGSITSGFSSLFGNSTKNQRQPLSSNSFDTNSVKQPEDDNLTKLINLQMANGSFKFGTVIQDLIGMTERQMIEKFHETEVDVVWITALALALLENKFTEEKELWELIANKAKMFIHTNAKTNFDDIMTKAKAFLA